MAAADGGFIVAEAARSEREDGRWLLELYNRAAVLDSGPVIGQEGLLVSFDDCGFRTHTDRETLRRARLLDREEPGPEGSTQGPAEVAELHRELRQLMVTTMSSLMTLTENDDSADAMDRINTWLQTRYPRYEKERALCR